MSKQAVLKIMKPRKLHTWQAYQKLFYDDKTKKEVGTAYQKYLDGLGLDEQAKKRFTFMNEFVKDSYEKSSKEIKDKCEAHQKQEHTTGSAVPEDPTQKNRDYQE